MTTSAPPPMPWLQPAFDALLAAHAAGRLPQAVLLHDAPGAGGRFLAQRFAQLVLCKGPTPACGECASCQRVLSGEHPDLYLVTPEEDAKLPIIKVDQIRALSDQLHMTSYEGKGTVAVLSPADAMQGASSNALLKTLEEPRAGAYLVLITTLPSRLPATLLSRCHRLRVRAPDSVEALQWLQAARPSPDWSAALDVLGAAPLDALQWDPAELRQIRDETLAAFRDAQAGRLDVVRTADYWAKNALPQRLTCIENHLTARALRAPGAGRQTAEMRGGAHLPATDLDINIPAVFALLDSVQDLRRQAITSLNKALAVERLLWRLQRSAAVR